MSAPDSVIMWRNKVYATRMRLNYPLEDDLVLAIIWQESFGNPWAFRPEPNYKWLWDVKANVPIQLQGSPLLDFPHFAGSGLQELYCQRASWGLMQVMGAAARERGFKGSYLTELLDPYTNLEYGMRHLWGYAFQKGNWGVHDALQRWNGGGIANYADEVLAKKVQLT